MKIALYTEHIYLPFWENPKNPDHFFKKEMQDWVFEERSKEPEKLLKDHYMMPILEGIQNIDIPEIMAHVSLMVDSENQILKQPLRIWVQFSTVPEEFPIIVEDEVQVYEIWGGNNGTYNPLQLLRGRNKNIDEASPDFWTEFFLLKIKEGIRKICRDAQRARKRADAVLSKCSNIEID